MLVAVLCPFDFVIAFERVLRRDVDDFVPQHVGQLGFVLNQRQRAARDVNEAAWRRKRVDAVGVQDDERPLEPRPSRSARPGRCPTSATYV